MPHSESTETKSSNTESELKNSASTTQVMDSCYLYAVLGDLSGKPGNGPWNINHLDVCMQKLPDLKSFNKDNPKP